MIHRLDLAHHFNNSTSLATRQLVWSAIGIACAIAVLVFVRDHRALARYTYTAMIAGFALLLLPLLPGVGREVRGAAHLDPGRAADIPAGRARQDPPRAVLRRVPGHRPGLAVARRAAGSWGCSCPAAATSARSSSRGWPASASSSSSSDLGTSLLFFGLFVAMLYVATERISWIVIGLLLFAAGAFLAWTLFAHVQVRVAIWLHPFDPANVATALPAHPGLVRDGQRRAARDRARPGSARPRAVRAERLHRRGHRRGARPGRASSPLLVLYGMLVERGLRTAVGVRDGFGKLLAAGLAFSIALQVFVVVGGVTRLIPLDRSHRPVPRLRWLLSGVELDHRGAAAADLRQRPAAAGERDAADGRGRAGDGGVNAPLRRLAGVVTVLFLALFGSATFIQFVSAPSLNAQAGNARTIYKEYSRERGPIVAGNASLATSKPVDDLYKYQRTYPVGSAVRPRDGLVRGGVRVGYGDGGSREPVPRGHRGPALLPAHLRPAHGEAAEGRLRRADDRSQGPAGGLGRPRGPAGGGGRARPEDGRDPGHGQQAVVRPQPARHPQPRGGGTGLQAAAGGPGQAPGQPGHRRFPVPARLDVQAHRHRRRALERPLPRGLPAAGPWRAAAAAVHGRAAERRPAAVRPEQPGEPRRRAADLVQHRVRQPRHVPRRPRPCRTRPPSSASAGRCRSR